MQMSLLEILCKFYLKALCKIFTFPFIANKNQVQLTAIMRKRQCVLFTRDNFWQNFVNESYVCVWYTKNCELLCIIIYLHINEWFSEFKSKIPNFYIMVLSYLTAAAIFCLSSRITNYSNIFISVKKEQKNYTIFKRRLLSKHVL